MDYTPPSSSVHEILLARILEWVAMPSSRGSSQELNPRFLSCRQILHPLSHLGSPYSAIKRSKFEPVELRWKNLESLIQNKVSQKDKNILYEHTHMESRKVVPMNLFAGQDQKETSRLDLWTQWVRRGWEELREEH